MTSIDSSHNKYDVSYNINESDIMEQQVINENDLKRSDLKAPQTINENDLKRSDLKPKRTLLQKIIKLHIFFCVQVTTILVATLIATRLHKCYDVLIYFSFGSFISILFIAAYSSSVSPTMTFNNSPVVVGEEGVGKLEFVVPDAKDYDDKLQAKRSVNGVINWFLYD
jgi:hypothetical protein